MKQIYRDLYQFSLYIPNIDFTIHQYLLFSKEPVLISTGTYSQAVNILPQIKELLKEKELKYIFVSHMESDEYGGLSVFKEAYPNITLVCSKLLERELPGFGYSFNILSKKGRDTFECGDFSFDFLDYPSEVHLQNGLLFYEKSHKIFFSGDLMTSSGNGTGKTMNANWKEAVDSINLERIPNEEKLKKMKSELIEIKPIFVAVGHGFCLKIDE